MPDEPAAELDPLTAERVRAAYLEPIRSVLVIDDDFSQYDAEVPGEEIARARALWRACRNRGLLCDIDDGSDLIEGQQADHLLRSDLVVLDYHLVDEEPKWALDLLWKLADSDHASVVLVYTKDPDIAGVRRRIAAHLRGGTPRERWFPTQPAADAWDAVADKIKYEPTGAIIEAFIAGNAKIYRADPPIQAEMKRLNIKGKEILPFVVDAMFESLLIERLEVTPQPPAAHRPFLGGGGGIPPWVYVKNLFVTCIQKTKQNENDGAVVFEALEKALIDWNPNFLLCAAAFARSEFARGGFRREREALANPDLQAGWLFHAWGGSEHEKEDRLRALFERVVMSYSSRVLNAVIKFGLKYVPASEKPGQTHETLKEAIKHFHGEQSRPAVEVMHTLNEFLVIEGIRPYVETGTIFARTSDDLTSGEAFLYVCATPSCDLVPRDPQAGSWESRIHPAHPIIAIRGQLFNPSDKYLGTAEQGRCVFLNVDGKQKALELIGEKSSVPILEWFFLENMGKIDHDGMVEAVQVERPIALTEQSPGGPTAPALGTKPLKLRILGQIRAIYASRILQYAGQHLSRIGVDFVNMPIDLDANKPKGKKN
jgi:hypothetical protein